MQLASHLFYSIEIIPYLFYSEAFAIKPVLLTQSTNRRSKNQLKDSLLNVLCHYMSIFYLLLLTSFVVRTPGPFGSTWTAINSRYDWTNQRLANSALGRLWFVKPGGRGGIRTHSPIGNGFTVRRSSPTLPPSHIKLDEASREARYNWESNPEVYSSAMYSKLLL